MLVSECCVGVWVWVCVCIHVHIVYVWSDDSDDDTDNENNSDDDNSDSDVWQLWTDFFPPLHVTGMYPHIQEAIARGEVLLEWDFSQGSPPKPLVKVFTCTLE